MLPPVVPSAAASSSPAFSWAGEPCCSAAVAVTIPPIISTAIAPYRAQPWRRLPTMRPYVNTSPAGIMRMNSSSTKPENAVGFSNGKAELTLKKPPPLVPSCLIAIWEAAGPIARVWLSPVTVLTSW